MDDNTHYIRMFNQFLSTGDMSSTYKPIFLRSLLDLGQYNIHGSNNSLVGSKWVEIDGDTITLDLAFIVTRFIKYYWDMEHSFKLRQTHNPNDAVILPIIRKAHENSSSKNPPTIKTIADDDHNDLRFKVIKSCIKPQVLKYLLTDMPDLYIRQKYTNKIKLKTSLISFLKEHRIIIKNSLNYKLTTYLGKINKSIPQIAMKIDEENYPSRKLDKKVEKAIDNEHQNHCFYCDRVYDTPKKRHIDHVIPFNYIFTTDVYNCVPACIHCNLSKSDILPKRYFFDCVIERNDRIVNKIKKFSSEIRKDFSNYDKDCYMRTYDNCIHDYHGDSLFFEPFKFIV